MNHYLEIAKSKTRVDRAAMEEYVRDGCKGIHESVFRSYAILSEVRVLLQKKVPSEVILDLIEIMESTNPESTGQ